MSEFYVADASWATVRVSVGSESATRLPDLGVSVKPHAGIPTMINRAQAYYWSRPWQKGERESLRDVEDGETRTFADGTSAVRWLLSGDDA